MYGLEGQRSKCRKDRLTKAEVLLATHTEPPGAAPTNAVPVHVHLALAIPTNEERRAVVAICILPLSAVRVCVGELFTGFVHGRKADRINIEFEAKRGEFVVEFFAGDATTKPVEQLGNSVAGAERYICNDRVVQVRGAASCHHRFLWCAGAVDRCGASDDRASRLDVRAKELKLLLRKIRRAEHRLRRSGRKVRGVFFEHHTIRVYRLRDLSLCHHLDGVTDFHGVILSCFPSNPRRNPGLCGHSEEWPNFKPLFTMTNCKSYQRTLILYYATYFTILQ